MDPAVLLALAASAVWGTADYLGGRAARRLPAIGSSMLSSLGAFLVAAAGLLLVRPQGPTTGAALLSIIVGVSGALGLAGLFRVLADGHAASAAPVAAVIGAAGPVIAGIVSGERPSAGALAGILLALPAVALLASGHRPEGDAPPEQLSANRSDTRRALLVATAAGISFAVYYVALDATDGTHVLWVTSIGNLTGMLALLLLGGSGLAAVVRSGSTGPPVATGIRTALISGPVYLLGTASFAAASARGGDLALIGPAASLYPLATVLIGRIVDDLRVHRVQLIGAGFAVAAMVLMSLG